MRRLTLCLVTLLACATPPPDTRSAPPPPPSAVASAPPPPASSAPSVAPPPPPPAPRTTGKLKIDRTLPLALWPESVVVIDDDAWITESGVRRVTKVSLTRDVPPIHVPVGRLPVALAVAPNRKLYTVAETDKQLWEIDPTTAKAKVFATLPDCPSDMAIDADAVWVLLWNKCSSEGSSIVRVGLSDRKQRLTEQTGRGAWALSHASGRAWVALGDGGVHVVGEPGVEPRLVTAPKRSETSRKVAAGPRGVYVTATDDVVRIDPATLARTHEARLDGRALTLFADDQRVVTAARGGTVWILDPETLATRLQLSSPVTGADPRHLAPYRDKLVLIDHGPDREHGRLFVLSIVPD